MHQKNIEESPKYSILVQVFGFGIFWLLPSIWISYLLEKICGLYPNDILLWIGLIMLNMAAYSVSDRLSEKLAAHTLWILIVLQLLVWGLS